MFEKVDLSTGFHHLIVGEKIREGGMVTDWKDLPAELLLRVISLLDDRSVILAACVCTGWKEVICSGLTHLCLSWCSRHMNELVISLASRFTKLQALILRQNRPQLEDQAIVALSGNCHDLRVLDLSNSLKLTDFSLYALAKGCSLLSKLNISGCSAFSDVALCHLTSVCRHLRSLNLCGCVRGATDRALQTIARNCTQLQALNLGWCENVTDVGVMSLAAGCPDLHALDLCGCVLITDESVIAVAKGCHRLKTLGLYYCQNITDRAMYSLAANGRMKGKHDTWNTLGPSCGSRNEEGLRNLNISQCTALTPPAVQALCDSFPALHTCSGRHSLIMSGCLNLTSVHCACAVQACQRDETLPRQVH